MKLIKAYIKAFKLHDVTLALHHIDGVSGATISKVAGFGRGKNDSTSGYRLGETPSEFDSHVKIEIVCSDENVEEIIKAIHHTAHTGLRGDGRIFVSEVEREIRIQDKPA